MGLPPEWPGGRLSPRKLDAQIAAQVQAAVLGLLGGVDPSGDTLAELLAALGTKETPAGAQAKVNALAATVAGKETPAGAQAKVDALAAALPATYAALTKLRRTVPLDQLQVRQRSLSAVPASITVSAADAPTAISNPVSVPPNNVARVRLSATWWSGSFSGSYYGGMNTDSTVDFPASAWETVLYGRYLDFEIDGSRGSKVMVDGRLVNDLAVFTPAGAGVYRIKVDCGATGVHHVKLITNALVKNLVYDGAIGSIWAPTSPLGITEYYIGDSWCQGYGADGTSAASYAPAGIASYCADLLGTNAFVGAESGTGYTNNAGGASGQTTFPNRIIPSVVPRNPARVVIAGSINDGGATPNAVGTAAALTYQRLRDGLPNAEVIVFGIQYPAAKIGDATYNALDDAIKAAALAAPNVRAFVSMRDWAIPAGFMRSDASHLTSAGYKYVGARMAHAIAAATAL